MNHFLRDILVKDHSLYEERRVTLKNNEKGSYRENWRGRLGFILASAGFAIGLGNIWRFPYVAGNNGGGAFLLIYVLIVLLIGIPLFYAEAGLGRKVQTSAVMGFRKLTKKGSPWVLIAWLGLVASGLIMSYYIMIMGWIFFYIVQVASGAFKDATTEQVVATFDHLVTNPTQVFGYSLIPVIIIGFVVAKGVRNGIERFSRFFMPVLFLLLVVLAIYSLSLPGALEGVVWYLKPDFSVITPSTFLEALGQAFFSVGIGFAAAFTYGSYLKPKTSNLVSDGAWVVILDTLIAFIAGLVIFPALFAFNIAPNSGTGLLFVTIPNMIDLLPGGIFIGLLFFFLFTIAALTTGVGLVETIVANLADLTGLKRTTSVMLTLSIMVLFSIPSILSQGPWSHIQMFGMDIFGIIDYISGNILLTISGLMLSLYIVFVWKFENYRKDLNIGAVGLKVSATLKPVINVLIPVSIMIILLSMIL